MERPPNTTLQASEATLANLPNLQWIKNSIWLMTGAYGILAINSLVRAGRLDHYALTMVAVGVLSLTFLRRRPVLAAWVVLGAIWWELTLVVYLRGTFCDTAVLAYPLLVNAAGWLVGGRGSTLVGIISVAGIMAAGFLGGAELNRMTLFNVQESFWLLSDVICIVASAVLTQLGLKSYSHVLAVTERERQRYRGLFEKVPVGLIGVDAEGVIQEVNDDAARLLGLSRAELADRSVVEILARAGLDSHFDLPRARDRSQPLELTVRGPDGHDVWLELSVQSTQVPTAPTLLLLRDLTQRKLIEEHLGHAQRLEAVGQLAGAIAHDFNNLLTAIGTSAEMIRLQGSADPRESVDIILSAQQRGSNLTRQLLAFARRDLHRPDVIDLSATVVSMTKLVERLLGKLHRLEMTRPDPVWINADTAQIEQVVLNLVTNACDAMPDGGRISVSVRILPRSEAGALGSQLTEVTQALLEVADTGTGIPLDLQARIFEPFFTTKPRGKGTGLGLAAVQGIVAQNQGYLALQSAPGAGAVFRIFFPTAPARRSGSSPNVPREVAGPGSRKRLLVVDDEEFVRNTTVKLLEKEGYAVTGAGDGEEALALLGQSAPPDLVLTDLAMPGMNGRELGERLHALHPELPVLYMSGYFNDPTLSHGRSVPAGGFLAKPFSREQLLTAVRAACGS